MPINITSTASRQWVSRLMSATIYSRLRKLHFNRILSRRHICSQGSGCGWGLETSLPLRHLGTPLLLPVVPHAQVRNTSQYSKKQNKKIYDILSTMPKKVDVKGLQEIRNARRQKVRKYPPSMVYLQVLGSGAPGAPRSLYVFTEQARYMFNCGEGSQRLACELKAKLSMMEHILITHKSWNNVGGLPGMLLTLEGTGVPKINLHGPPGIETLYYDTRHFIKFRDMNINYKHYKENDGFIGDKTDPLQIQAVPIWGKKPKSARSGEADPPATTEVVEDLFAHEKPWLKKKDTAQSEQKSEPQRHQQNQEESRECRHLTMAYICRPPPKAGTLLLEKCVKAGIKPGPLLGELKAGYDVTLDDGRVVRAADVTAPADPGPVFIVIEIPTEDYLDSLFDCTSFEPYQPMGAKDGDLADVVVHFTPAKVMANPYYQEWMSKFSPSTNHIIVNDASTCMGSEAVHRIQYKLNHLNGDLFPLLQDQSIPLRTPSQSKESSPVVDAKEEESAVEMDNSDSSGSYEWVTGPTHQARTLLTYHIRPRKKLDWSSCVTLNTESYVKECYQQEKFETALKDAKERMEAARIPGDESESYPNVIFLGTGSCIPSKTRNTSSILVNLSSNKTLLMDCGEGTYGQFVRHLGLEKTDEALRNLGAVYVSHLHADHHIGFIRVLQGRRNAFHRAGITDIPKLYLLAPNKILPYLSSYNANFEPVLRDLFLIPNQKLLTNDFKLDKDLYNQLCSQLDMKSIDMTYVIHCPNSFGVAWTHVDGWKLAYSGDTMPCSGLVEIGRDCDLLIHEATMEDELEEEARIKTHSTTSQAIQVGRDMNAKNILLTHFSQRYAKVPLFENGIPDKVGIAFDNMKVSLRDMPMLQHMYGALVAMFADDYDEMLEKTAKKRAAKELLQQQIEELTSKQEVTLRKKAKLEKVEENIEIEEDKMSIQT